MTPELMPPITVNSKRRRLLSGLLLWPALPVSAAPAPPAAAGVSVSIRDDVGRDLTLRTPLQRTVISIATPPNSCAPSAPCKLWSGWISTPPKVIATGPV